MSNAPVPHDGGRRSLRLVPVALVGIAVGAFAFGAYLIEEGAPDLRPASSDNDRDAQADAASRAAGEPSAEGTSGTRITPPIPAPAPPAPPTSSASPPSPSRPVAAAPDRAGVPQAAPRPVATPRPERGAATTGRVSPGSARRAEADRPGGPDRAHDISGEWTVATRVESTNRRAFEGMQLGYRVQLRQEGNQVFGEGYKITENGRSIAGGGRTPISVRGTRDGERLTLSFTEQGARRSSSGTFVLFRQDDGVMEGRFSSDAAASAGRVEARRR